MINYARAYLADAKNHKIIIPVIAVLLGFLLGSIIMLLTKENPWLLYKAMIQAVFGVNIDTLGTDRSSFSIRRVGEYFVYVMPIVLTGLSVAFAFRTGLFNIGAEGQLIMGAFAATALGIYLDLPKAILLPTVIMGGALAGAAWGFIPGYLKARFNVHEVVVTIMLNYAAMYITNFLLKLLPGSDSIKTAPLNSGALLSSELLAMLTSNSRLHYGFIVVILALIIFSFIINKTNFGFELKAVGLNIHATEYAGMKSRRNAALAMAIAGSFAGLAGAILVSGTFGYGRVLSHFENYGFDGIAVALIGGSTAIGTLLGALLLGALKAAQPIMQSDGISKAITIIIYASIIVFIAMRKHISRMLVKISRLD